MNTHVDEWVMSCPTIQHTRSLGSTLGEVAVVGCVVCLMGDLGAGKTTFAQGVGQGLGVLDDVVSPTFVLISEYEGRIPFLHADLYRLTATELDVLGLEEILETCNGVAVVEWGDRFPVVFPVDRLEVKIHFEGEGRVLQVKATGTHHRSILQAWRQRVVATTSF